jgi:hypothetical protein
MCFDVFHSFASRLQVCLPLEGDAGPDLNIRDLVFPRDVLKKTFGVAFLPDRSQPSGLRERKKCQHHACVE